MLPRSEELLSEHLILLHNPTSKWICLTPVNRESSGIITVLAIEQSCMCPAILSPLYLYPVMCFGRGLCTLPTIGGYVFIMCYSFSAHPFGTPPNVTTSNIISTICWVSLISVNMLSG